MTGLMYNAALGRNAPIAGATVRLVSCFPRAFNTTSGPDGRYSLFVPGSYLGCTSVGIGASAAGYGSGLLGASGRPVGTSAARFRAAARGSTERDTHAISYTPSVVSYYANAG